MSTEPDTPEPPVVWMLQTAPPSQPPRDFSSCQGYGAMQEVLEHDEHPSKDPVGVMARLRAVLSDAQDGDYILFAGGDPMTPFCAALVLSQLGLSEINWLRWDRRTNPDGTRSNYGYYTPVRVALPELQPIEISEEEYPHQ